MFYVLMCILMAQFNIKSHLPFKAKLHYRAISTQYGHYYVIQLTIDY